DTDGNLAAVGDEEAGDRLGFLRHDGVSLFLWRLRPTRGGRGYPSEEPIRFPSRKGKNRETWRAASSGRTLPLPFCEEIIRVVSAEPTRSQTISWGVDCQNITSPGHAAGKNEAILVLASTTDKSPGRLQRMKVRDLIRRLRDYGWTQVSQE